MMKKITDLLPGQTPLTEEDLRGLIPSHVSTKGELNEFEAQNIDKVVQKYLIGKGATLDLTDLADLKKLHREMFDETWKWAGKFRLHDTQPIGSEWRQIQNHTKNACDDFSFWIKNKTFDLLETAVRFHHKLIFIHPFPNGNGRHGRFVADIFLNQNGHQPLSWGGSNLSGAHKIRENYLSAMKKADKNDFSSLLEFAKSCS